MQIEVCPISQLFTSGTAVVLQEGTEVTCEGLVETEVVTSGQLARMIKATAFEGRVGQVLTVPAPAGSQLDRLVLVGIHGARKSLDFRHIGAKIAVLPEVVAAGTISLFVPQQIDAVIRGICLRAYSFDNYRDAQPMLSSVRICGGETISSETLSSIRIEIEATHFVRDLINEPANMLPPMTMAARVATAGREAGVAVEILETSELKKLGFGLLLGVGQGAANPPCIIVMRIGDCKNPPLALVGKGVCFDTGGVNVKPVMGMWEMKGDMGGAAAAAGAMIALARSGYKGDVVAVLGLAENMTGGNAIRPGDILRSYSGQTVEVRNTDCEGRLILGDCLSYAQRELGARKIIDLATLTYAVQIGLGTRYAGLYGNSKELVAGIQHAADAACELVWPMPVDEAFHEQLKSDFADMLNWPGVTYGNASIATAFLEKFIDSGTEWAHIDIAGPSYTDAGTVFAPPGGTGVMVETLVRFLTAS